jgi:hypothetical protein
METTVYNPQKGRLETINVEFTKDNTTWFSLCRNTDDILKITDYEGDLLISECSYNYPIRVPDISRSDIGHDRKKAQELRRQYE